VSGRGGERVGSGADADGANAIADSVDGTASATHGASFNNGVCALTTLTKWSWLQLVA
jgi:hypothetical protein